MTNLTENEISSEILEAEKEIENWESEYINFWQKVKIQPKKWAQYQYDKSDDFWVIALAGKNCLYFNYIEKGWGWGCYEKYGEISVFHYQQDEIQHAIYQMVFNIYN